MGFPAAVCDTDLILKHLLNCVNSSLCPVPPFRFLPSFSWLSPEDSSCCAGSVWPPHRTLPDWPLLSEHCTFTHTHTHTLSRPVTLCSITSHCHHLQGMLTESDWQQKGTGVTEKNIKEVEGTDWNRGTTWAQEVDVSSTRQALALWRVLKGLDWTLQNRGNGEGKEAQ